MLSPLFIRQVLSSINFYVVLVDLNGRVYWNDPIFSDCLNDDNGHIYKYNDDVPPFLGPYQFWVTIRPLRRTECPRETLPTPRNQRPPVKRSRKYLDLKSLTSSHADLFRECQRLTLSFQKAAQCSAANAGNVWRRVWTRGWRARLVISTSVTQHTYASGCKVILLRLPRAVGYMSHIFLEFEWSQISHGEMLATQSSLLSS